MAFIDQKQTIIDIVLTDKARQLLSEEDLNFAYYAFSDEGIDYSGSISLTSSLNNVSLDDFLHRDLSFEADQRLGKDSQEPQNLKTFLFTIPQGKDTIPELKINITGSINLKKKYSVHKFSDFESVVTKPELSNKLVVFNVEEGSGDLDDYVAFQYWKKMLGENK